MYDPPVAAKSKVPLLIAFHSWVAGETEPAGFRNSAGFKKLLERLNVPDYWRKHGYPPQCHAVGASDFSCDAPRLKAVK